MKVPIEISAHHFHATKADFLTLFGDCDPKVVKNLSQKGQFSSDKVAKAITDAGEISLRFLGPFRKQTQVELTKTDTYKLKIDPPICESVCQNDEENCQLSDQAAEITLSGPKGSFKKKVAILAQRHLHINSQKAKELGIKDKQMVRLGVGGPRSLTFNHILARVSPDFDFQVHLDTDEANAAGISNRDCGELFLED
jgi:propanediol utilization protein